MAEEKATFCLATGLSPADYDSLTLLETEAFVKIHNKNNKKK